MEYQYGSAQVSSSSVCWTIRSNAARYIRCHGRKNQLPCWQLHHRSLLVSGPPKGSARPWIAAWNRQPSGSEGFSPGGSRSRILPTATS